MTIKPQNAAKQYIGAIEETHEAKKAADVVVVVKNIAYADSGRAFTAISSVDFVGNFSLVFFHLSVATIRSSAPSAAETNRPTKFKREKNLMPSTKR